MDVVIGSDRSSRPTSDRSGAGLGSVVRPDVIWWSCFIADLELDGFSLSLLKNYVLSLVVIRSYFKKFHLALLKSDFPLTVKVCFSIQFSDGSSWRGHLRDI